MIQPGKYEATVSTYGSGQLPTGTPYVFVTFNAQGESVSWKGFLSEKAIEKTMEQLNYLNCRDFVAIADGPPGNALDMNVKVRITVEHEVDKKDASKKYAVVKWINPLSSARVQDAGQIAQAKSTLEKFQGQFLASKQKMGKTTTKVQVDF